MSPIHISLTIDSNPFYWLFNQKMFLGKAQFSEASFSQNMLPKIEFIKEELPPPKMPNHFTQEILFEA